MGSKIKPHGGKLVQAELTGRERDEQARRARELKHICLTDGTACALQLIATGALSPLEGFMGEADYHQVLDRMCLTNGLAWPLPITLPVDPKAASNLKENEDVALLDERGRLLGSLHLRQKYPRDRAREMDQIYGTQEDSHPGVRRMSQESGTKTMLLGGEVRLLQRFQPKDFAPFCLDPIDTRYFFQRMGWKRIVGFQDSNPFHRAYEYVQKCALEIADGLLVHVLHDTGGDGLPTSVKMRASQVMLENYYPRDRVLLAVFPIELRHAGLRETLLHAIIRKNYGCTHFVVGYHCLGVENFCTGLGACSNSPAPSAGERPLMESFHTARLGISLLFFHEIFYCKKCRTIASRKTCPHDEEHRFSLKGIEVKKMLEAGQIPPRELVRQEAVQIALGCLPPEDDGAETSPPEQKEEKNTKT